ncbi:MAG: disulfide bond formation protein B [Bacteroidetes bacterium]|nr:disulfide bond formation protein B [Bacteroidota bacterium]
MNLKGLYTLNSLAQLIVLSILLGAFYFQFGLHENPCPLCLLQRMGMMGIIIGLSLNTWFGMRKAHFGIVILSAIVGAAFSFRQILLHICPAAGEPTGYGTAVLGMHLYTWGLIAFVMSIAGAAVFLFFKEEKEVKKRTPMVFEKVVSYLFLAVILVNIIASIFECQLGPCCDDGPCIH